MTSPKYPLPGHQAGAPLRLEAGQPVLRPEHQPSPAIRPGLRCGSGTPRASRPAARRPPRPSGRGSVAAGIAGWWWPSWEAPPRPSGRGSVAAPRWPDRRGAPCHALPGHQAGAPLRRTAQSGMVDGWCGPSPAIRPGLRCGAVLGTLGGHVGLPPRPSGRGSVAAESTSCWYSRRNTGSLPGHQAGAPLRRPSALVRARARSDPPRPSGRGSVAARCLHGRHLNHPSPLPGHQAGAPLRRQTATAASVTASPALPGHQAGAPLRPAVLGLSGSWCAALPGHQAGAPLRQRRDDRAAHDRSEPSPAIRPGLRCGAMAGRTLSNPEGLPPRPSGRGSVAARTPHPWRPSPHPSPHRPSGRGSVAARTSRSRECWRCSMALPGHQAGAPLRPRSRHRRESSATPLPGHQAGAPLRPPLLMQFDIRTIRTLPGHQAGAPLRLG